MITESGLPGFSVLSWFGLYAPRRLPTELASRINEEVNKVLRSSDMAGLATVDVEPGVGSPAEFATRVTSNTARWSRLAKELKMM